MRVVPSSATTSASGAATTAIVPTHPGHGLLAGETIHTTEKHPYGGPWLVARDLETAYDVALRQVPNRSFVLRCESRSRRDRAEMPDLRESFKAEVERFREWAAAYPLPLAERSGEWECDYGGWQHLYKAFAALVDATACQEWSAMTAQTILYAIARQ